MPLTNRIRAGGFIQSEANGFRSRDQITILGGTDGGVYLPGTVLGKLTVGGKYLPSVNSAADGSQTAIAVLFDYVDSTDGDVLAAVVSRDAEVRADDLTYDASVNDGTKEAAKVAQLAAVGIIVRS